MFTNASFTVTGLNPRLLKASTGPPGVVARRMVLFQGLPLTLGVVMAALFGLAQPRVGLDALPRPGQPDPKTAE